MGMLKELCNKALYLKHGQLLNTGKVQDIITEYLFTSKEDQNKNSDHITEKSNNLCNVSFFSIKNRLKQSTKEFYFREDLNIDIEIDMKDYLSQIIFDITIVNSQGDIVAYGYTTQSYSIRPGKCKIQINIANNLLPGDYSVNFGMHKNTGQTLYSLEGIKRIKVQSTAVNQVFDYSFHWIHGSICLDAKWKVEQR
jgi:lipopolysaccharide transport system ATP-binding protein